MSSGFDAERAERMVRIAREKGADNAAMAAVIDIPFRPEFREQCEANRCGHYGRSWMCPPAVGEIGPMIEEARRRREALVFQSIGQLKDSFDYRAMESAAVRHQEVTQGLADELRPGLPDALILGAGSCRTCRRCAKREEEPCRFPERAFPSLESYGIAVSELAAVCGLNYINGKNTVTYFGAVLF